MKTKHFPVIVLASNGERTFPPPFLRRCIPFRMPTPKEKFLTEVVEGYLGSVPPDEQETIKQFVARLESGSNLAIDQLLNLIHLRSGAVAKDSAIRQEVRERLVKALPGLLLKDLSDR